MQAVKIDRDMPLVQAALLGCGVVSGFGAAATVGGIAPGQTMAVVGCGGLGLNAIQAGRIVGASRIVAIDVSAAKLRRALAMGATDVVDPADGDALEQVRALTNGSGVDLS